MSVELYLDRAFKRLYSDLRTCVQIAERGVRSLGLFKALTASSVEVLFLGAGGVRDPSPKGGARKSSS